MSKLTRRNFIKVGGFSILSGQLLGLSSCLSKGPQGETAGQIVFMTKLRSQEKKEYYKIIALDIKSGKTLEHPLDFKSHSITLNPHSPPMAFLAAKKGPHAAMINLQTGQILAQKKHMTSREFNGHGIFINNGATIITSETENSRGLLAFRDSKTLEIIKEIPSHGATPHMLYHLEKENLVAACNSDKDEFAGVCYVDIQTGSLSKRVSTFQAGISPGHLFVKNNLIFIAGTELQSGSSKVLYIDGDQKLHQLLYPSNDQTKFKEELFNICTDKSGEMVCSVSPRDNYICFWNLKDKKILKILEFKEPHGAGLTDDGSHFYVLDNKALHFVATENLTIVPGKKIFHFGENMMLYGHPTQLDQSFKLKIG